jgi:hypothetical protein
MSFPSDQTNIEYTFAEKVNFLESIEVEDTVTAGALTVVGTGIVQQLFEKNVVSEASINGEIIINVLDGSLYNFTTNASGNFTFNIRANESTSLNSLMLDRRSIVITSLIPMGSSAYVLSNPSTSGFKIDGTAVTVKWIGSSPPSSGFSNSINSYTFAIIKNSADNYTVLGTLTRFG